MEAYECVPAPVKKSDADRFADRLVACNTSVSVLFFLKLPPSILESTALGRTLRALAAELGVSRFDGEFMTQVKHRARHAPRAADEFYTHAPKKDAAIQRFEEMVQRKRAAATSRDQGPYAYLGSHMPLCVQFLLPKSKDSDSPFAGALFFVFSTYELGLRTCLSVLRDTFRGTPFTQVYEVRLKTTPFSLPSDSPLGYLILDWEVEESKLRDEGGNLRLERHEIEALRNAFALWFYRRLLAVGAILGNTIVSGEA
jgi:hypothetical protein